MSSYQTALANAISCLSWHIFTSQVRLTRKSATLSYLERSEESRLSTKDSLEESPEILQVCHSEGARSATEESLSNLLESPQRFFGAEAPQNDNKSNPQDKITLQRKLVCHSEERRSLTEELLLSTKDSLIETLERRLLCHSEHCEETPPESPVTPLFCHSEGARSATEESLNESLVTHRDSSPVSQAQNDNKSPTSFSSEIYSHCDKIKSHEVPPLKTTPLWGIYKGEGALVVCWTSRTSEALAHTCTFKPLPLVEKEKRESPASPLLCHSERYGESLRKATRQSLSYCHSEGFMPEESLFDSPEVLQVCHSEGARSATEESLKESLVAKRDSSVVTTPARHDNSGRVSSNSKRDSSPVSQAQNDNGMESTRNPKSNDSQKAHRDSSAFAKPQNDNESNPQDKITLQGK